MTRILYLANKTEHTRSRSTYQYDSFVNFQLDLNTKSTLKA